jgi:hypothetical protein
LQHQFVQPVEVGNFPPRREASSSDSRATRASW